MLDKFIHQNHNQNRFHSRNACAGLKSMQVFSDPKFAYGSPLSNAETVSKSSRFHSQKSNDFLTLQMTLLALKAKLLLDLRGLG